MTNTEFATLYATLSAFVQSSPAVIEFAGWPQAEYRETAPLPVPVIETLAGWQGAMIPETQALCDALRTVWMLAHWQQTYSEAEVGRNFLDNYGYFELVGPFGHFHSEDIRAYIAYWGPGLYYDWHRHEAEELYVILAGEAVFEAEGQSAALLRAGDVRMHTSNQPHAMLTEGSGVLALVLWRGSGLDGAARMGRA